MLRRSRRLLERVLWSDELTLVRPNLASHSVTQRVNRQQCRVSRGSILPTDTVVYNYGGASGSLTSLGLVDEGRLVNVSLGQVNKHRLVDEPPPSLTSLPSVTRLWAR